MRKIDGDKLLKVIEKNIEELVDDIQEVAFEGAFLDKDSVDLIISDKGKLVSFYEIKSKVESGEFDVKGD